MTQLSDIEIFVRIVEDGGISAAAERLRLSKSVVSRRLRALEQHLGVELIKRTTRSQRLTETGQIFFDRCVEIVALVKEAETTATQSRKTLSGTLRISAPMHYSERYLAPIIAEFLKTHSELTIDVDLADSYANLVSDGFDLAIRIGSLDDSSLRARKLMTIPGVVCASPAYLDAQGRPDNGVALNEHWGLLHRSGEAISDWTYRRDDNTSARLRPKARLISNNDNLLLGAAERGLGVLCVPRFIVESSIAAGRLEVILADLRWQEFDVHIVYPPARHLSSRIRSFIDFASPKLARA